MTLLLAAAGPDAVFIASDRRAHHVATYTVADETQKMLATAGVIAVFGGYGRAVVTMRKYHLFENAASLISAARRAYGESREHALSKGVEEDQGFHGYVAHFGTFNDPQITAFMLRGEQDDTPIVSSGSVSALGSVKDATKIAEAEANKLVSGGKLKVGQWAIATTRIVAAMKPVEVGFPLDMCLLTRKGQHIAVVGDDGTPPDWLLDVVKA